MSRLILLIGGVRSGKSALAVRWAAALGGEQVTFLATARAEDEEMQQRIAAHQAQRPASWPTIEVPRHVGRVLAQVSHRVAILDCLTLWVSNTLLEDGEAAVATEMEELLSAWRTWRGTLLVVTNEVGQGIIPDNALARRYQEALGWANQRLRQEATKAYYVVAGGVLPLNPPPARP